MPPLIQELINEHAKISELFLKARDSGLDTKQGRDLILSAKKMLLAHLNKEDQYLYPVLREAAKNDETLRAILSDYALDMEKISADIMLFFTMYEGGGNTLENFQKDCNNCIRALSKRIAKEESVLYKAYNKIQDNKGA